jgi:hypothetical protein
MAMQDPILFTGKELNLEIPKFTELNAANDRLRVKLNREEDLQREAQAELRKNMDVDLETFTSNFAMKQQADMAKAFTDKWTLRAKQRGNKLTNDDLMEQRADAINMASRQKDWLSSQKQWDMDAALIKQRAEDYDVDKFKQDTDTYVRTGVYKPNSLEYSGINMADYFGAEKWVSPVKGSAQQMTSQGGKDIYTTVSYNTTPELAKQHIVQTILNDPTGRRLKGVMRDFQEASDSKKMEYLKEYDTNNSGTIEPEEMANVKVSDRNIMNNPIMKFAQDQYLPYVYRQDVDTREKRTPKSATEGGGSTMLPDFGTLLETKNQKFGSSNYTSFFLSPKSNPTVNLPLKGGRVLTTRGGGDKPLKTTESIQGLNFAGVGVNANGKVELIFRSPTNNFLNLGEAAGTNIAFPIESNPEYMNVELKDEQGKVFTVKNLLNNNTSSTTTSARSIMEELKQRSETNGR